MRTDRLTPIAGSFAAHAVAFGVLTSITSLVRTLSIASDTDRAWVSLATSIPIFLVLLTSGAAGRMADNYGARRMIVGGGGLSTVALLLGAFAHSEVVALVAVGVPLGVGMSGLFVPSLRQVEVRSTEATRARSIGLAAAGTSIGTLTLPPAVLGATRGAGLATTFVGLAVVTGIGTAVAALASDAHHDRPQVRVSRARVSRHLAAVGLLVGMAYYMPLAHLAAAAEDAGMSKAGAALTLAIVGASNLAGRVGVGRLYSPRRWRMWLALSTGTLGVSLMFFSPTDPSAIHVLGAAALYGVASGAFVVCLPTVALERARASSPGAVIGAIYRSLAPGAVAGPVLAGLWFDMHGTYSVAAVAIGACALSASLLALIGYTHDHAFEASSTN